MKLKYRMKSTIQFFAFAFYPKTTLLVCAAVALVVIALLGLIMPVTENGSNTYNIFFALTTGAVASFFVAVIVELSNNYRHNKLAWYELQEYYRCITHHKNMKLVLMHQTPFQIAAEKARDDFSAQEGYIVVESGDNSDEDDRPKDIVEATWALLPEIIPVYSNTLKTKKAFLSEKEIEALSGIMVLYDEIKREISIILLMSPMTHNVMNHPDESCLNAIYPKNILSDTPEWVRKQLARKESRNAMDRLADTVLSDRFLHYRLLKDYDISQKGIDSYDDHEDDHYYNDNNYSEAEDDEDIEYDYPETEEEFKAMNEAINKQLTEERKPFVSWHISKCCSDIAEYIEELEKITLKNLITAFILSSTAKQIFHRTIQSSKPPTKKKRIAYINFLTVRNKNIENVKACLPDNMQIKESTLPDLTLFFALPISHKSKAAQFTSLLLMISNYVIIVAARESNGETNSKTVRNAGKALFFSMGFFFLICSICSSR